MGPEKSYVLHRVVDGPLDGPFFAQALQLYNLCKVVQKRGATDTYI